jgi:hypothetical protein
MRKVMRTKIDESYIVAQRTSDRCRW